jgi:glycosyltransferase involved in cell wall biosynthesis
MPCFNVETTIDEAMDSLVNQTLRQMEIITIDDGSSDRTLEILQGWADRDERVYVLAREHEGIIPALNAGITLCRAPHIARMDADDRSHPERLAKQVEVLESDPGLAVCASLVEGFPVEHVREGFRIYIDWLNRLVSHEAITREIFIESPLAHPSVAFRKRWVEKVGGYQEHGWPEDYDLWLRLYLAGARFAKVPEILLYWREHEQRLTRTDSRYSVENFIRAKAHYLCQGPLVEKDSVIIWGAGQMGRRLSKHLERQGAPLTAFIDIDPGKIGRERRGRPIVSADNLRSLLEAAERSIVLAAVSSRGARALIRERLNGMGLREGVDWWAVA